MPRRIHDDPPDWGEIARSIKEREGWRCKDCRVEQGAVIVRDERNPADWHYASDAERIDASRGLIKLVTVVLSVHHIGVQKPDGSPGDPNDKMDVRPENLEALCSRCHLVKDIDTHIQHAKETRIVNKRQAKVEAGQGELF
jgi:hypothetical protein